MFDAMFRLLRVGGELAHLVQPAFCVMLAALALWRRPGGGSALVGVGAAVSLVPFVMKLIGGPWTAISPIYSSPAEIEQHHAVLFLYWQGTPIGFMLCAVGMLWLLWCQLPPRGTGSRADETPADRPQRGQA